MSSESNLHELPIPGLASSHSDSVEVIRVWIAQGGQHFTLRLDLWEDPAAWGLLLADIARNVAVASTKGVEADQAAALQRIKLAFDVELENT